MPGEVVEAIDDEVGAGAVDVHAPGVPVAHAHHRAGGGAGGGDVRRRVAHHHAVLRAHAETLRRMTQRRRIRLALGEGVAADHGAEPGSDAEGIQQGAGEPLGLVGDAGELEPRAAPMVQGRLDPGIEKALRAQIVGVRLEEAGQPLLGEGFLDLAGGVAGEGTAHQHAGAMTHPAPDLPDAALGPAEVAQHAWWTEEDAAAFQELADKLGAQYSTYEPIEGFPLDPALTMGENIGDVGGLAMAYHAYKLSLNGEEAPVIDGYTGDQRFFLAWAQVWKRQVREEALKNQIARGPHSPARYRVNGVVRNMDAWYNAFGIEEGDDLYLAPEDRVQIW